MQGIFSFESEFSLRKQTVFELEKKFGKFPVHKHSTMPQALQDVIRTFAQGSAGTTFQPPQQRNSLPVHPAISVGPQVPLLGPMLQKDGHVPTTSLSAVDLASSSAPSRIQPLLVVFLEPNSVLRILSHFWSMPLHILALSVSLELNSVLRRHLVLQPVQTSRLVQSPKSPAFFLDRLPLHKPPSPVFCLNQSKMGSVRPNLNLVPLSSGQIFATPPKA